MDKRQNDELGKAAGLFLQGTDTQQVTSNMFVLLHMPIHYRRGGVKALSMRRFHYLEPLRCINLIRAKRRPDFIVQNFSCCTR